MSLPSDIQPGSRGVRTMFDHIAARYELMNSVMTFGRDRAWRRRVLELAAPPAKGSLLDVGTGTGAIARAAAQRRNDLHITGCDFSPRMLEIAKNSPCGDRVAWHLADALALPFPDAVFDCVTSGYLIRNTGAPAAAFREQARILKPGGRLVCLETAPVPSGIMSPLIRFYLRCVLPALGRLLAGAGPAYGYLGATTEEFISPERMAAIIRDEGGLTMEATERRMFGTQAIIAATKR